MISKQKTMTTKELLQEIDKLDYSERIRYIALLGRTCKNEKQYIEMLYELLSGGVYEARLALEGALAIRNNEVIIKALEHPKESIRLIASKLIGKWGTDEEIESVLMHLSPNCGKKLIKSLCKNERREVAMKCIEDIYTYYGAQSAVKVLPLCSAQIVEEWLPRVGNEVMSWNKMAQKHPQKVLEYLEVELEKANQREKKYIWQRFYDGIEVLCKIAPETILEYALQIDVKILFTSKDFAKLVESYPDKVFELLMSTEGQQNLLSYGVPKSLLNRRQYFSIQQWIEIGKVLADREWAVTKLLSYMKPSKRKEIFEGIYKLEERTNRIFTEKLLYPLPHALRDAEAKRMLGLREIIEDNEKVMLITAYQDIKDSRVFFEKESTSSDADERGKALAYLIKSTELSREGMKETLKFLTRFKNDQDPVKLEMMKALSNCPSDRFKEEHEIELTAIVNGVIEARDTSGSTYRYMAKLAFNLLKGYFNQSSNKLFSLGLDTLIKIMQAEGDINFADYKGDMPKGLEKTILEALYPSLQQAHKQEDYHTCLKMAQAFGKRGYELDKLQDLLKEVTYADGQWISANGARRWLMNPKTRGERVEALLKEDQSFITIDEAFSYIHYSKQSQLDEFISGKVIKGKFLSGDTIHLVSPKDGFFRWLPRQQKIFANLIGRVISGSQYSMDMRIRAVETTGKMPDIDVEEYLFPLLESTEVPIVEATLKAIAHTQEPEKALPILLQYLEGDRARVAIFAVSVCLKKIKKQTAFGTLKKVLEKKETKLTVKKELIRLLGTFKGKESICILEELIETASHKDIIIAIGHAARNMLEEEVAWYILDKIAQHTDKDVARSLLGQPTYGMNEVERKRYLEIVIKLTKHPNSEVGARAFWAMMRFSMGNEEQSAQVAVKELVNFEDAVRWKMAARLLMDMHEEEKVHSQIIKAFKILVDTPISNQWNIKIQRDLPHRQRISWLAERFIGLPVEKISPLCTLYKGIIEQTKKDETLLNLTLKLMVVSLDLSQIDINQVEETVNLLNEIGAHISKQPYLMNEIYSHVISVAQEAGAYWKVETIIEVIRKIQMCGNIEAQYLTLALLEILGQQLLWNEDCIALLENYREHENIAIRSRALRIFMIEE